MPTIASSTRAVTGAPAGSSTRARGRRRAEAAFTLIEMLVVMLIIGIIIAMIVSTFRGTKKATYAKSAQSVAFSYQDAVEAYMADNGQRAPVVGQREWPVQDRGPVDPMFSNKPYMRTMPEHVQGGMVDFIVQGQSIQPQAQAVVEYRIDPANNGLYTFTVWVIEGTSGVRHLECVVTNRGQLASNEKKCVS